MIPAPDLHPFFQRRPELAAWLLDCRDRGDAIAQHGLRHRRVRPPGPLRRPLAAWQGGAAAEFPGLDASETDRVGRGRPTHSELARHSSRAASSRPPTRTRRSCAPRWRSRFDWWATLLSLWRADAAALPSPALCLGTSSRLKLALSPLLVRAGAATAGRVLRLDLHPADFEHPRHVLALESVLRRARTAGRHL